MYFSLPTKILWHFLCSRLQALIIVEESMVILLYMIINLFNYVLRWFCFVFLSCLCMAIIVSVQHDSEFLPDIMLLTQCCYHRGTRLNAMKRFCICSLGSYLNVLTCFPLTGGCSEGLDAFRCFFKNCSLQIWDFYRNTYKFSSSTVTFSSREKNVRMVEV